MPTTTGAKVMEFLRETARRYHSSPTTGNVIALLIIYAVLAVIGVLIWFFGPPS